jgi:tight adherence protein B
MRKLLLVVAALVLGVLPALGQSSQAIEIIDFNGSRYPTGGETRLVIEFRNFASAPVAADIGVTVNGLEVSNLEILPIGQSQVPIGVVLAIDASGSMSGDALAAAKAAAIDFVGRASTGDQMALITFSDTVSVISGFTNRPADLVSHIESIEAGGETAFNDAVVQGVRMFDSGGAVNLIANLVILTDGADTSSTATLAEAVREVESRDVRVFGIALEGSEFDSAAVQAVSEAGNGLFLATPDPNQLNNLYGSVAREISNTMVARFISPVATPGPAEFVVTYGGLTAAETFTVSGFATTTTAGPTTTVTFPPPSTMVVTNQSPLDMETLLLMAAGGIALTLFLFIIILFGRDSEEDPNRFVKRLQAYGRRGGPEVVEKKSLLHRIPLLNRFSAAAEEEARKRGALSGMNAALEQANVPMTPGEAILAMMGLSAVGGILVWIFNGLLAGVIAFGVFLLLTIGIINFLGGREKRKFEKQLPDTLTLMSTSLRAGYSLLQATEAVSNEAQNPTAREFGRAIAEARLGRSVSDALKGVVDRTQSKDFEWATMAIEIQREVGGNLAEVLTTVADTMRQRNRLKGEIKALTAEGRISAIVLGALPFVMALFLYTTNRDYLMPLLEDPMGRIAIGVGLLLMAGGVFWLKKIVDIEI